MPIKEVQISDLQIASCSLWKEASGALFLPVFHVLPFFQTLAANAELPDLELGTPPDYDFVCRAIGSTGTTPGTLVQVQWPDGRYLSNPGVDFFSFVGTGRRGRLIDPGKRMKPGQKIRLNIDNSLVNTTSTMEIYFEGVLLVPMSVS